MNGWMITITTSTTSHKLEGKKNNKHIHPELTKDLDYSSKFHLHFHPSIQVVFHSNCL
jgi:hypothetical protein